MYGQVNWGCGHSSLITASCSSNMLLRRAIFYRHTVVTCLYLGLLMVGTILPRLSAEGGHGSMSARLSVSLYDYDTVISD